jgi:hypothetical protein
MSRRCEHTKYSTICLAMRNMHTVHREVKRAVLTLHSQNRGSGLCTVQRKAGCGLDCPRTGRTASVSLRATPFVILTNLSGAGRVISAVLWTEWWQSHRSGESVTLNFFWGSPRWRKSSGAERAVRCASTRPELTVSLNCYTKKDDLGSLGGRTGAVSIL